MARKVINLGTSPNKGDGDPLRIAMTKINDNFDELYNELGPQRDIVGVEVRGADSTILVDGIDSTINLNGTVKDNIVPQVNLANNIGDELKRFSKIYGSIATANSTLLVDAENSSINLNGTDLIPTIIKNFDNQKNISFIIIGSSEPWLSIAAKKLIKNNNIFLLDGYNNAHTNLKFVEKHINKNKLNVILLAMGMPKQEKFAETISSKFINHQGCIISGGAIIDFTGGKIQRANNFLRMIGMEWFYRFLKEPKRMFFRYIIGIPRFIFRVLFNRI